MERGTASEKSDVEMLVDTGLHGLRFVDFMDELQDAHGKKVDLLDISYIEPESRIDREISETGVTVYEE